MKVAFLLVAGSLAVVLGIAVRAADPPTVASPANDPTPERLIGFLPMDSIVDLRFSENACRVRVLSKQLVQQHLEQATALARDYEELKSQGNGDDDAAREKKLDELERRSHRLSSPWKVVGVGDNFVRLEPLSQLPFHERTPWFVLPESSITYIKGTN